MANDGADKTKILAQCNALCGAREKKDDEITKEKVDFLFHVANINNWVLNCYLKNGPDE